MRILSNFVLLTGICAMVTACGAPDRVSADRKLDKACQAAVQALLTGNDVIEVESTNFTDETAPDGATLRVVEAQAYVSYDGGGYEDQPYKCAFFENTGKFRMGYSAKVEYIEFEGEVYGKQDGVIEGTFEDNLKITEAVNSVLR